MADTYEQPNWPARPWTLAAIGAAAGLIVHLLTSGYAYPEPVPLWKQAATAFTIVASISFILTAELRRWQWSVAFAAGWGGVIALVGWFTAQYNRGGEIIEFPFLSGILAVLIAAPLFQTIRDEGRWRLDYPRLHRHAWTDAVIGAAAIGFTGVVFLLALLIAALFDLIGIALFKELLEETWFCWMLAGLAFGGGVGLLRQRAALLATLQTLVRTVLSVLAPVLAVALGAFLLSLPFTGLTGLWDSDLPATPMLLLSAAGAVILVNSVIGDGTDEPPARWLEWASVLLLLCVLPLAVLAGLSIGERIAQHGWTPPRIWGVIAVMITLAYGIAGWWSVIAGRQAFGQRLRQSQIYLAVSVCGLALFLALPIVDFGAISARSQLARLESGQVKPEEFDWAAMAFDFGPAGRRRLHAIASSGPPAQRAMASAALRSTDRYTIGQETERVAQRARIADKLRILSPDIRLDEPLIGAVTGRDGCNDRPCALIRLDEDRLLLVHDPHGTGPQLRTIRPADLQQGDKLENPRAAPPGTSDARTTDLARAQIEIRSVERRQLYVDGRPVGDVFE